MESVTAVTPLARAALCRCPCSPKPVMSVAHPTPALQCSACAFCVERRHPIGHGVHRDPTGEAQHREACHDGAMVQGGVSGLVTRTVFKIVERQILSLAGSIPVRLRHAPGT